MRPNSHTYSNQLSIWLITGLIMVSGMILTAILSAGNLGPGNSLVLLPFAIGLVAVVFINPYSGFIFYVLLSFSYFGLNRYFVEQPMGVIMNAILFLVLLSAVVRINKANLSDLKSGLLLITFFGLIYGLFYIAFASPLTFSDCFFAVQKSGIFILFTVPLTLLLFNEKKHLDTFINILVTGGLLGAIWGLKQVLFGLDYYESNWINSVSGVLDEYNTRIRAFSFFSDAFQFGSLMAYISLICFILFFGPYRLLLRVTFAATFVICILGLNASGSWMPLLIFFIGLFSYLILNKKEITGITLLLLFLAVLTFIKYAEFGNNINQIQQIKREIHLNNDISQLGLLGILISISAMIYVLVMGKRKIELHKNRESRQKLLALYAGLCGLFAISLISPVTVQTPLCVLILVSMTLLSVAGKFDITHQALPRKFAKS